MRKLLSIVAALGIAASLPYTANATPEQDLKDFRAYFKKRFPQVPFNEFGNGVYAIDPESRAQWEAIEDFPPYEVAIENGKKLFETPFKNGKTYASCFPNGGIGIRQDYPKFDATKGEVVTLESAINDCREANGEKPLPNKGGAIADLVSYMAYTSRGNKMNVVIPNDPRALAIYERGKQHFYAKRGQLNMACADCHVYNAGNYVRADLLSPALGHVTHFPVYRSNSGSMVNLQDRYAGCNKQVRAKDYPLQGDEYRALEYFHSYMSNGIEVNGPGSRK
ncbi:MAG: sulfur oxidation c-type cytochrome SoxA [Gammaproteobacteria bacterium]|nr:sulfur oxidation c-type cytochrome SoxA [Gammaproteobacteria bacterium]